MNHSTAKSPEELREELLAELQSKKPDSDRIADLAGAIANSDPERARFSVDAGMLARLGRELMARHETALSELVKNAYDADAERVIVRIAGISSGNYIEVSDDGSGMTRESLLNGFMRLATNDKIEQPYSIKFKRRRAGRKGVGRFAAERLGSRLVLTTATETAKHALQMKIDWNRFVPGLNLSTVSVPIEVVGVTSSSQMPPTSRSSSLSRKTRLHPVTAPIESDAIFRSGLLASKVSRKQTGLPA